MNVSAFEAEVDRLKRKLLQETERYETEIKNLHWQNSNLREQDDVRTHKKVHVLQVRLECR